MKTNSEVMRDMKILYDHYKKYGGSRHDLLGIGRDLTMIYETRNQSLDLLNRREI